MTELLKKAFEKAGELPEYEQDEFGKRLLKAIEDDEQRWDAALGDPNSLRMKKLVDQVLEDIREGRTEPLDPEQT